MGPLQAKLLLPQPTPSAGNSRDPLCKKSINSHLAPSSQKKGSYWLELLCRLVPWSLFLSVAAIHWLSPKSQRRNLILFVTHEIKVSKDTGRGCRVVETLPAAAAREPSALSTGRGLFPFWPSLQQCGMETRPWGWRQRMRGWEEKLLKEGTWSRKLRQAVTNQHHCCPGTSTDEDLQF